MSVLSGVENAEVDPDLSALIESLLGERAGAREEEPAGLEAALWAELQEAGLAKLTGGGEFGSDASWLEAAELLRSAARRARRVPLAENDLLGGWLAEQAGLPDVENLRTSAIADAEGRAYGVPWARSAVSVVLLQPDGDAWYVREVPTAEMEIAPGENLAGEPRDAVRVGGDPSSGSRMDAHVLEEWKLRGALARAVQISGALERAVEIAVRYSMERIQFGRPVGAFQAVQHLAATMASEAALVMAATDSAALTAATAEDWTDPQVVFDIAVAKSCASTAASVVTRGAHQILGAIGTTAEHELHRVTLPAIAWAGEFGSADEWNRRILELTASPARPAETWELITRTRG
ncbi:acyl-CoA dehydrogenase family protein [Microbacterium sp. MAHUQ-60]|uniref:acyl-CoA dehydrogenase family protein n=1 Tax=unclassified Microbacterium TaxID=2609290 RepID=UPI00360A262B